MSTPNNDASRESIPTLRLNGKTTRQMQAAPLGAVYVWCNTRLDYPLHLAQYLGRTDLKIVSPNWVHPEKLRGYRQRINMVVDHATEWTPHLREAEEVLMRNHVSTSALSQA